MSYHTPVDWVTRAMVADPGLEHQIRLTVNSGELQVGCACGVAEVPLRDPISAEHANQLWQQHLNHAKLDT